MFWILTEVSFDKGGVNCLRYAQRVAQTLQGGLLIRIPQDEEPTLLFEGLRERHDVDLSGATCIRSDVVLRALPREDELIYVSHLSLDKARKLTPEEAHLLLSHGESSGDRSRPRCICLPFGNRDAGLRAAEVVFPLAQVISGQVHAVHTTYSKSMIQDERPESHMEEGARQVQERLQKRATASDVQIDFRIAMADTITDFVIQAAADAHCQLIVVSPGTALYGSNADGIAMRSHIPVLIVNHMRRMQ